jgi:hypothetical protein
LGEREGKKGAFHQEKQGSAHYIIDEHGLFNPPKELAMWSKCQNRLQKLVGFVG